MANEGESPSASETENIVTRVTNLPLVSSAYGLCASLYHHAKETYPCINTACNIAEMLAAVAIGSARGGAQPILTHLEPQIATVNEYACKGLDKLEEKVPCLHQPTHQVFEHGVTLTKSVVNSTVQVASEAKGIMSRRAAEAVDLTKDIVQDSISLTKLVVNSSVHVARNAANETKELVAHRVADVVNLSKETVQDGVGLSKAVMSSVVNGAQQVQSSGAVQEGVEMSGFLRQALASGVEAVLERTEEMVDHYLPMTEEELAQLATEAQAGLSAPVEEQRKQQSFFVRLGSLSSRFRHRAHLHSLNRLHLVKANMQSTLSQLQLVISLVENLKNAPGQQFQETQQKLSQILLKWSQTQLGAAPVARGDSPPEVESATLAMLRVVTQDLGPAYARLVSSVERLPSSLREKVDQARGNIHQFHASFSSASSLQDLSSSFLAQSPEIISQAQGVLDLLVEYIAQNRPLDWIVGPFRPGGAPGQEVLPKGTESAQEDSKDQMAREEAMEPRGTAPQPGRAALKMKAVEVDGRGAGKGTPNEEEEEGEEAAAAMSRKVKKAKK